MKRVSGCILTFLLLTQAAWAEPHYSALFGQSCFLCHTNPTGRGMRSLYGSQFFAPTYLPVRPVTAELLEKIKPQLSESVLIGADLRTIWLSENTQNDTLEAGLNAAPSTNTGTIAQMEGNLYLALQPADRFLIYYSQGIAQASGRYEMYGEAGVLPWNGFVKAGQFQENYGWIFADHTAYTRTGLFAGFMGMEAQSPLPPHYGVGAEIGIRPKFFGINGDFTASFTNAQTSIPMARDMQKRWTARGQLQTGIQSLGLQFTAGGSWFHAPRKPADAEYPFFAEMARNSAWGGFGSIGWNGLTGWYGDERQGFGFLATAALFEYDRKAWTPVGMTDPITSAYSTAQVSLMAYPGVWLYGSYDWLDNGRNIMIPPGTNAESERTTLGVQFFPLPWVEIAPRYRLISLAGPAQQNKQWAELQAHFYF